MADEVIITAALTGSIHTPSMSPYLPITPEQLADEAVRVYEAGAAVAHIHVRNPETGQPVADLDLFERLASEVKRRCPIVLCFTTGGGLGMTVEERGAVIPRFKPELASCNFGSMNFALHRILERKREYTYAWEEPFLAGTENVIFPNTFLTIRQFLTVFAEHRTKAELEMYDLGMINNLASMIQTGHVQKPVYMQFVLGILGGAPATPDNLLFMHRTAKDLIGDFTWSVCAAGRAQIGLCTMALVLGGNVRVGLEDNLYLERGVLAKSNAEQVEKIARIARELGREPATPDQAREILGLKGLAEVAF